MNLILTAKNIQKSFVNTQEKKLNILKGVNLDLECNTINMIVGKSGAGKSTLLHILGGLDYSDTGSVSILGTDISKLNDSSLSLFRNNHIGFIFQFHHLLPEFSALENVMIPQLIQKTSQKDAEIRGSELLDFVGLKDRLKHKPAELSGGEQQRVAVARALANSPDLIFADEPTGNLDSQNSELINSLFLKLKKEFNVTFLIVTHNKDIASLADNIFQMKDGLLQY